MAKKPHYAVGLIRVPNTIPVEWDVKNAKEAYHILSHPEHAGAFEAHPDDMWIVRQDENIVAYSHVGPAGQWAVVNKPPHTVVEFARENAFSRFDQEMDRKALQQYGVAWNTFWLTSTDFIAMFNVLLQCRRTNKQLSFTLLNTIQNACGLDLFETLPQLKEIRPIQKRHGLPDGYGHACFYALQSANVDGPHAASKSIVDAYGFMEPMAGGFPESAPRLCESLRTVVPFWEMMAGVDRS